ncbi:MAG: hypothetical protein WBD86_00315 [Microgenomates group bacterium]
MKIERMVDQQVETERSLRRLEKRRGHERRREAEAGGFIASAIEEQSDAMARFTVSPTPDAFLQRERLQGTMPAVAKALFKVEVVDPNINRRIKKISEQPQKATEDDKALVTAVVLGKAKVLEENQSLDRKEKKRLKDFKDTLLQGVGKTISSLGGRRALGITTAFSLALTACGTAVTPEAPEPGQGTESITTEVAKTPTPKATLTPSPSSTATETQTATATPSILLEHGPGSRGSFEKEYPSTLGLEEVKLLLSKEGLLPGGFWNDLEVKKKIEEMELLLNKSRSKDADEVEGEFDVGVVYWGEGEDFWWDIVIKDSEEKIVAWLMIGNDSTETEWRYAEEPTWDPNFNPEKDKFKFGQPPEKLHPDNYYELVLYKGHRILVEIDYREEMPIRWLNTTEQKMKFLEGITFPFLTPEQKSKAISYKAAKGLAAQDCTLTYFALPKDIIALEAYLDGLYERAGLDRNDPRIEFMGQNAGYGGCWVGSALDGYPASGTMIYEDSKGQLITIPVVDAW